MPSERLTRDELLAVLTDQHRVIGVDSVEVGDDGIDVDHGSRCPPGRPTSGASAEASVELLARCRSRSRATSGTSATPIRPKKRCLAPRKPAASIT